MKQILLSLIIILLSLGAGAQEDSQHSHTPGYEFRILEGVNSVANAVSVDSLLTVTLTGLVLSSKTDPATKTARVQVANIRVVYRMLYDMLVVHGYKPSTEYTMIEHEH